MLLHDYAGAAVSTRVVAALDIARTLAEEIDLSTGLLPPETLWYARTSTGDRLAIWRAPRVWNVQVKASYDAKALALKLPMPGLVFLCQRNWTSPFVFAAVKRPTDPGDQLYHCPTFNVFRDGRVCPGNHTFIKDPARVPEDFFKSFFSLTGDSRGRTRSHSDDLLTFWKDLAKQKTFPLDELQPALTVADAMRIGQ